MKSKALLIICIAWFGAQAAYGQALWSKAKLYDVTRLGNPATPTNSYIPIQINFQELTSMLSQSPNETSDAMDHPDQGLRLELPTENGASELFGVFRFDMMESGLQIQFPGIRTFIARGLRNPGLFARLDLTEQGFHAMIYGGKSTLYLDPWKPGDLTHYQLYTKDQINTQLKGSFQEFDLGGKEESLDKSGGNNPAAITASGNQLRTYRLALAATAEYTTFHGGTTSLALSAMVTTMNRVNGIFEKEVSIRMVLISNTNLLIYTNPLTDPYTNGDATSMISENQSNITTVIGPSAYDIGHVFGTNSGGLAALNSVCNASSKASGVTGGSSPVGDAFDIDYVAHELGHQFGAQHTFNSVTGSCSGNRTSTSAYEPGSGTTIMAYAGICGADNIQTNSNAYFHFHSYNQIVSFSIGNGGACAVVTPTGNAAPSISASASGVIIPKSTPFKLSAIGSDPNGDVLTYCWEQSDLGSAGAPNSPSGNAPLFRSFSPTASESRVFPSWNDILTNTQTKGEIMPSYARNLSFKVTARDNRAAGGGVNQASASIVVSGTAGPFVIIAPNAGGTWISGNNGTITWDVAGTNISPINCTNVNLWLSVDGGQNFSVPLVLNTPNDGSQTFVVPNTPTSQGRVMVEAVGNIFFDVNNVNIVVQGATGVVSTPIITPGSKTFNTALNVIMSCSTVGALIYFTTNGNTPVPGTGFTKVYMGPFAVVSNTTVRAMGVRQNFNNSATAVANYTLNTPSVQAATPFITPGSGTYSGPQTVSISSSTQGAVIYYTTNGNSPVIGTTFTKVYSGSFIIPGTSTVRAVSVKEGMSNSAIAVANLTITTPSQVATPIISPGTGTYSAPVAVSISSATSGAIIYYTITGNEPVPGTSFTKVYSGSFVANATTTVRALAVKVNMVQSKVGVAFLTVINNNLLATPAISPGTGLFSNPQTVNITCATAGVTIYYTTTGNTPVVGTGFTKVYAGPFVVNSTTTIKSIAVKSGSANSAMASSVITISGGRAAAATSSTINEEQTVLSSRLEVMPNPTSGKVIVRWSGKGAEGTLLKVYNTLGSEIMTIMVGSEMNDYNLDLSELRAGIYFVKTDRHPKLVRIIKQ